MEVEGHPPSIQKSASLAPAARPHGAVAASQMPAFNLILATVAFGVSFALWGLVAGLAPLFRDEFHLSATQAGLLVAVPVLTGSLGRIALGYLADRFGGRIVFAVLLAFGQVPTAALAMHTTYVDLLFWGLWLGLLGASFPVGTGFVARWFEPRRQGTALGVYGIGNVGQTFAVMVAPLLARAVGVPATFVVFGTASLGWALAFWLLASDAAGGRAPASPGKSGRILGSGMTWLLSFFYFQTFGGFVAFAVTLPLLLHGLFHLDVTQAGYRTAGFILVSTLARPVGGWLADRFGGPCILKGAFFVIAGSALLFTAVEALPARTGVLALVLFSGAALIGGVAMGMGNGAVFKLVPLYFPKQAATVAGIVGAAGGLGGFFPPLVLGSVQDLTGSYVIGFVLLGAFALTCLALVDASFPAGGLADLSNYATTDRAPESADGA